jgi:hypothetical protein
LLVVCGMLALLYQACILVYDFLSKYLLEGPGMSNDSSL